MIPGLERGAVFTFLHISDLHFWDEPPENEERFRKLALIPFLDGVLGHEQAALRRLYSFHQELSENAQGRLALIVTGDVTAWGAGPQFRLASDFLGSAISSGVRSVGLARPDWRQYSIPGNHDHWPGNAWVFGEPGPDLAANFTTPLVRDLQLPTGHLLRFIGIDSDADVNPHWVDRLLALGSFESELRQVAGDDVKGVVPILLVHHSAQETNPIAMRIRGGSMRMLMEFLFSKRIPVMLTGHCHQGLAIHIDGTGHRVLEARCGTTTAIDRLHAGIEARLPGGISFSVEWYKERKPNALFVHQVLERGGRLAWVARDYVATELGFHRGSFEETVWLN